MERRSTSLPPDGLEHLAERPRGDEPRDRFVLEERLAAHVADDPEGEQDHAPQGGAERRARATAESDEGQRERLAP